MKSFRIFSLYALLLTTLIHSHAAAELLVTLDQAVNHEITIFSEPALWDTLNLEFRFADGPCFAVDANANIAAVGNGGNIDFIQYTDTNQAFFLGRTVTPGVVYDIQLINNYVYAALGKAGVTIIDITDPLNPQTITVFDTPGFANQIRADTNKLFIADGPAGMAVWDITTPANPSQLGSYFTGGSVNGIAVDENGNVYIADQTNGVKILDVSNPATPTPIGSHQTTGPALDIEVKNNHAYVIDMFSGLRVLDVSNPANPIEVGAFNQGGFLEGVSLGDNYAFVGRGIDGIAVIDITNPTTPNQVGQFNTDGNARTAVQKGNFVIVADEEKGAKILDFEYQPVPQPFDDYPTCGFSRNVSVLDETIATAQQSAGVSFYRFQWAATSGYRTQIYGNSSSQTFDILLRKRNDGKDEALTADGYNGLRISRFENHGADVIVESTYNTPGKAMGVVVEGDYAYVADDFGGLRIIDISDRENPVEAGFINTIGYCQSVTIRGNYAYAACGGDGLIIIDISDPNSPVEIGSVSIGSYARRVGLNGDYAYVACGEVGVGIIDISDPSNPVLKLVDEIDGKAVDVSILQKYMYVADEDNGLRIFDILNPENPLEVAQQETNGNAVGVKAFTSEKDKNSGTVHVLLADGNDGLYIFKHQIVTDVKNEPQLPDEFILYNCYPNPFNPTTKIRYSVPFIETHGGASVQNISLKVYDVLGNEIATLVNEEKAPGNYEVNFNSAGLSSGVYFYKITYGSNFITKKMMLLR
ncbi:MAG: hypothetical protein CO127_08780 [Ignavibacteria bacterium CG_4_9_14_3_um_filter_36_18]|nr:MAG: hypothetical protein CO127_08780 [Ignavibacteria bacterium CG_4_9_14_3_um_filter_36_18]